MNIKGKTLKVVEQLKKEIIKETKNIKLNDISFECNGVEEIQREINEYLEIINTIYQDLLIEYIDWDSRIFVKRDLNGEIGYNKIGADNDEY